MVCNTYVPHAFKPDVCRECGVKKAQHAPAAAASSAAAPASTPAPAAKPAAAAPVTPAKPSPTPALASASAPTTAPSTPVRSFAPIAVIAPTPSPSAPAAVKSAVAPSPFAAATSTPGRPRAGSHGYTEVEKAACAHFEKNAYVPLICKNCTLPQSAHGASAIPAVTVTSASSSAPSTSAPVSSSSESTSPPVKLPAVAGASTSSAQPKAVLGPTAMPSKIASAVAPAPAPVTATAAVSASHASSTTSASAPAKRSKACGEFTAHSFFPLKCRECSMPKAEHTISAPSATPPAAAAPVPVVSASTKAKFSSPFSVAATVSTSARSVTTSTTAPSAPVLPSPSTSGGIKQRLASLGGGFNPMLAGQAPPSKPMTPTAAAQSAKKEEEADGDGRPPGVVKKPSIGTTRRQPSVTLPHFNPLSPSEHQEQQEGEVAAVVDDNGHAESPRTVHSAEAAQSSQAAAEEAEPKATTNSPALPSFPSEPVPSLADSAAQSTDQGAGEAEVTSAVRKESPVAASLSPAKHASLWDDDDDAASSGLFAGLVKPASGSQTAQKTTPSSTTALPLSDRSNGPLRASPVASSSADASPDKDNDSLTEYIAQAKMASAASASVVRATSSSLFGDDWDDDADVPVPAPAKAAAAPAAVQRVQPVTLPDIFSTPLTPTPPVSEAAEAPNVAEAQPAPPPVVAAVTTAPPPSSAPGKPAPPPRVSSSVFFGRPGTTSSSSSSNAQAAASSTHASPSSVPPASASKPTAGVFFKVNSLGLSQRVSDAVSVVPVQAHKAVDDSAERKRSWDADADKGDAPTARKPVNLFGDDDIDEPLFTGTTSAQHLKPVVALPSRTVLSTAGQGDEDDEA